jgi:chorismate-pyruvate lyase
MTEFPLVPPADPLGRALRRSRDLQRRSAELAKASDAALARAERARAMRERDVADSIRGKGGS